MRNFIVKVIAKRPSPGLAVAFIALRAALSSSAVALPGKNIVDSGDIKKGAVKRSDISRKAVNGGKVVNGSLTGADVRDDSLTGADIDEGTLGQVPSANTANTANSANSANTAITANTANTANNVAAPEAFHKVGAAGEPPFKNGCTNFQEDDGVEFESVGFYKDREGVVHLQGVYQCPAAGDIPFQLPPGYRPTNGRYLAPTVGCGGCVRTDSDGDTVTVENGLLVIVGAGAMPGDSSVDGALVGEGHIVGLDGVTFRAGG
jgi:hypothetical protein